MINEFKKVAPAIVESVKVRVTADMTEQQIMMVIHEEIVSYFTKQQQMFVEYMTFNEDQRATFAAVMYDVMAPLASSFKDMVNPKYAAYVERTGKTGALNFIVNAS